MVSGRVSAPTPRRGPLARLRATPFWVWPAVAGLAVHALTAVLRLNVFWPYPDTPDFGAFYTQAWALRQGAPLYNWPATWVGELSAAQGLPAAVPPSNSLPLTAAFYLPFTLLPYPAAACLWLAAMLAVMAGCSVRLARLAGLGRGAAPWVCLLSVIYGPTFLNLTLGQNAPLALLAALALGSAVVAGVPGMGSDKSGNGGERGDPRGWARWAWAALALMPPLWLKLWPAAMAAVLPLWRPRGRGLAVWAALLAALALNVVALPEASRAYLGELFPGLWGQFAGAAGLEDQSLLAWLLRLTQPQEYTVSGLDVAVGHAVSWAPLLALPAGAVRVGIYALLAMVGAAAAVLALRAGAAEREGALYLWVLAVVLAAPHVERYNHVLLLPAMAWLWGRGGRGAVAAAVLLTGLARLTHLWALALPGSMAALFSGTGTLAALWLAVAMARRLWRGSAGR